jgi:hypothetical protein
MHRADYMHMLMSTYTHVRNTRTHTNTSIYIHISARMHTSTRVHTHKQHVKYEHI